VNLTKILSSRKLRILWWEALKQHWFTFEHHYFTLSGFKESARFFLTRSDLAHHLRDRLLFRIFPKFWITSSFPTHVELESASACQLRCPMCYTTYMDNNLKGIMSWDLYTRLVDECAQRGVYSIKLSWRGEPLLNKNIVKMVKYAKDKGVPDVAFLSNGEKLTPEICDQLIEAGLDWISFSFDGFKETYDVIRKPAVFEETMARIKTLRQKRDALGLSKPLIRVQSIYSVIKHDPDGFKRIWDGIADKVNFIADQIRSFEEGKIEHNPFYQCPTPWQRMAVSYEGKVHQCISDYGGLNILGDFSKKSLYEIWHDKPFRELRKSFQKFKYLDNAPCRICSDGAITENLQIKVQGQNRSIRLFKGIETKLDAKK
jgi:radical SAM protein with 4Fe4S-binding SPASM domain